MIHNSKVREVSNPWDSTTFPVPGWKNSKRVDHQPQDRDTQFVLTSDFDTLQMAFCVWEISHGKHFFNTDGCSAPGLPLTTKIFQSLNFWQFLTLPELYHFYPQPDTDILICASDTSLSGHYYATRRTTPDRTDPVS